MHQGASSVGVVLVQLLSAWGGHVTATLSNSSHVQLAHMLGVHDAICADETDLERALDLREKSVPLFFWAKFLRRSIHVMNYWD